jgi:DNA-binding beta-propeller fold protein YncE
VTATIPVGKNPVAIAVNPVTNKIYVANCPDVTSRTKGINGTISVIDGDTNSSEIVQAGLCPTAVAVNPVTNKIYVANFGHTSLYCGSCFDYGSITVIDGVTNATTTVADSNAKFPVAVAVNPVTNKIYVANNWNGSSGDVTVIDGATSSTTSVSVGPWPYDLAVNTASNKIYVTSFNPYVAETGTAVSVIDGATNNYVALTDPNADDPIAVAVNPITNKIYVANHGNIGKNGTNIGSITVIDGATNSITNLIDANANSPHAVAINPVSNKVYIANANGVVTELDGATNSIRTITDPSATNSCDFFGTSNIDSTRNLAYVANCGSNNVTVIDGTTNSVVTVTDSSALEPIAVAVNSVTNKIYVANGGSNNVTVIDGGVGTRPEFILSVTGAGSGRVTSNPAGIDCGSTCAASFAAGTPVTLTASPGSDFTFSGWSGACSGTSTCSITMASNESVTATFNSSPPPDFSLTPAFASLTMKPRGQTTDVITIAPQNGSFSDAVQLSCAVLGSTPMATCALSSSSLIVGANSATSILTITAPAQSAELIPSNGGYLAGAPYAVFLPLPGLTLIAWGLVSGKSNNWKRQLWLASSLLIVFVVMQVGCGGGTSTTPPPVPSLNYTVTVTATAGAIHHSIQVSVAVQ